MAFNPLHSFQKNKRFWMAAILMICMVSFVFCTGMRGDMSERIPHLFRWSTGPAVATIDGRNISKRDLDELRTQRKLANTYMKHCNDLAFKNVTRRFYEFSKNVDNDKEFEKRREGLFHLEKMRATFAQRKTRDSYFDIGFKFDDLLEFKLWQAEADRLGIRFEEEHVDILFSLEFFQNILAREFPLGREELARAQHEARSEFRDASDAYVRRAIAEEFRVKIAQYALLGSQPGSLLFRPKSQLGEPKYTMPDVKDEVRAPLTLAQIWDFYKAQRGEIGVSLIPVPVQRFVDDVKDPDDIQKQEFFNANKNDTYDPTSDKWGLDNPPQFKFEYVMADSRSSAYLDEAKLIAQLKLMNPLAFDAVQSPLMAAVRVMAVGQAHKMDWQGHYDAQSKPGRHYHGAALFSDSDYTTPILAYMAGRHPQAVASLVAANAFPSMNPLGEAANASAGYLAWGTKKYPLDGTIVESDKTKVISKVLSNYAPERYGDPGKPIATPVPYLELDIAIHSERVRRLPVYRDSFAFAWSMGTAFSPMGMAVAPAFLSMDPSKEIPKMTPEGQPVIDFVKNRLVTESAYIHPLHTIETVQREFQDMLARRTAEEWAQENIRTIKTALEQAGGPDPEKSFQRELNELVPKLKLTYGPSDEKKGEFHDRYTIEASKEFAPLKEAYLKYLPIINLFEGRDTPARKLKPEDFHKIFAGTEPFAANAKYRVMPWPPEVKADNTRELQTIDPRIKRAVAPEDLLRFEKHVAEHDPNRPAPSLKLYLTAERPILYWRTAEANAPKPADYKQINADIQKFKDERAKLEDELKKNPAETQLSGKVAELKKKEADLLYIKARITEGFKFERSRKDITLPRAKDIAKKVSGGGNSLEAIKNEVFDLNKDKDKELKRDDVLNKYVITLSNLSPMHREDFGGGRVDYTAPELPKDAIPYPRDGMMHDLLSLYDLKGPIKIGNPELDEINKDLFEEANKGSKDDKKKPERFVQILTNKPRSVFYVAVVTSLPDPQRRPFLQSMLSAHYPQDKMPGMRDLFLDKAQEHEARTYRADFIRGLQSAHEFAIVDKDARGQFDGTQ